MKAEAFYAIDGCVYPMLDLRMSTHAAGKKSAVLAAPHHLKDVPNLLFSGRKPGNGKPNTSKGSANGYVITFGDKRVYVTGETENVPEAKAQKRIDVAFLPVNNKRGVAGGGAGLRTMTPAMFSETVNSIRPKVVYPYAYGNNDPKELASLVKDPAIETRVRDLK